ncbi:MAG: hypothetical protein COW48_07585 [Hydrogenophilales bacterium CG17_big_fil_post_rev_8_21_14_2_50_63_12]|nr:MAG: hypothetical protein COW48_07585 [Hydrogenophilales bacterium CG17_big_fil_post_rev_8_21_14_2_50_63_12]PIX98444.1 MAG: hypothetical protein COZ24_00125 [Hydrogenophilales bacterium CG_4_10_14_3_um_filter_63_21]
MTSTAAICATFDAQYPHAREPDDVDEICRCSVEHTAGDQACAIEIAVRLAEFYLTLYFAPTHWFDLKTILSIQDHQP